MLTRKREEKRLAEIYEKQVAGANPSGDKNLYNPNKQNKQLDDAYQKVKHDEMQKFNKEI